MRSNSTARWVKVFAIVILALAILSAERFVSGARQQASLFRVAMDFVAFGVVFVGLRFWTAPRAVSGTRTIVLLAVLLLGLLVASFAFPGFAARGGNFGNNLIRFASLEIAEAIPAIVALAFIIYAVVWWLRGANR